MATSWAAGQPEPHLPTSDRHFARRKSVAERAPAVDEESRGMGWSWRLGRFFGINVYIHFTFLLLLAWLVFIHARQGATVVETAMGIAFVLALFGCVVLHEYGHALTARKFGVKTRDITLLPIGGVARLERIPKDPKEEFLVAIAGPAVNAVIALVLFIFLVLTNRGYGELERTLSMPGANPIADLMSINISLIIFNMLPAFPMDGGRVLRALLAMKLPRVKATRIAATLGKTMAVLFAVVGMFGIRGYMPPQPFLLFIALFVFMGAAQEYQTTKWEAAVDGLTARDALQTNFRTLLASDPLSHAVAVLLQGSQHDFPVLDENLRVVGLLLRQDLIAALNRDGGINQLVSSAMREAPAPAEPDEPIVQVFERMQSLQIPILPVFEKDSGKLLGLLTMENIAEVVMIRNALEKSSDERVSAG